MAIRFPYFPPPPPAVKPPSHPAPPPPAAKPPSHSAPPPPAAKPPSHSAPPPPAAKPPSHSTPPPPAAKPPSPSTPPPPSPAAKPPSPSTPPPPSHSTPPPPHQPFSPPPPHVHPPPALPPHVAPPLPPSPSPNHPTVIIIIFISFGSVFFLAFLAIALCCFIKKKKKKSTIQETKVIHFDEHRKIKEAIVEGPHGPQAVVLSVEDDVHIDEVIKKNEKSDKRWPSSSSNVQETDFIHVDEHEKVKEGIVEGPHGSKAMMLTIDDDIHVDEEICKNERSGKDGHHHLVHKAGL